MTYTTDTNKERGAPIRRSISWGTKLILGVFGIGLFKTELQRILSLPRTLNTDLYLVLLIATILLTAGWIFVANKEFDIICDFLDPEDYSVPDETVTSLAVASILTILLYASRNPLWFGISYSIYCALSVYAWIHMKNEMQRAVMGSRRRLEKEPLTGAPFISDALDALYSYYVTQPNVPRLTTSLGLSLIGLTLSIVGAETAHKDVSTIAYFVYLSSVIGLELGLAFYWRARLYSKVRPLQAAMAEFKRRA